MNASFSSRNLSCDNAGSLCDAYADGALTGETLQEMERHLGSCQRCAQAVRRSKRERERFLDLLSEARMRRSVADDVVRRLRRRKRIRFLYGAVSAVAACVLALLGLWAWMSVPSGNQEKPNIVAQIPRCFGTVADLEGVARIGTQYLKGGENVPCGQLLTTRAGARVKIRSRWGDEILVGGDSQLRFAAGRERKIALEKGRVFCRVRKEKRDFVVSCPEADVRVRGTVFHVAVTDSGMSAVLIRGEIELAPRVGEATVLAAGRKAVVNRAGGIVSIRPLDATKDEKSLDRWLACAGERPIRQKKGKVWIYGRVTLKSGAPARDATVRIALGPGPKIPRGEDAAQSVDEQGRFVFTNLDPGTYVLAVELNGRRRLVTDPPIRAQQTDRGFRIDFTLKR